MKKVICVILLCSMLTACGKAENTADVAVAETEIAETTVISDNTETSAETSDTEVSVEETKVTTVDEHVSKEKLSDEELIEIIKEQHNDFVPYDSSFEGFTVNYQVHRADSENNTFIVVTEGIGMNDNFFVYDVNGELVAKESMMFEKDNYDDILIYETDAATFLFFDLMLNRDEGCVYQYIITSDEINRIEHIYDANGIDGVIEVSATIDGEEIVVYKNVMTDDGWINEYPDFQADIKEILNTALNGQSDESVETAAETTVFADDFGDGSNLLWGESIIDLNNDGKREKIFDSNMFGQCSIAYYDSNDEKQVVSLEIMSSYGCNWYLSNTNQILNLYFYGHTTGSGTGFGINLYDFNTEDIIKCHSYSATGGYVDAENETPTDMVYSIDGENVSLETFLEETKALSEAFKEEMGIDLFVADKTNPNNYVFNTYESCKSNLVPEY